MPLIQISVVEGKTVEQLKALMDGVHQALQTAWGISENDRFQTLTEHKRDFRFVDKKMWGVDRSDEVILIHITSIPRTKEMKLNLYKELVGVLAGKLALTREEDIFVTIVHNEPENWTFGKGLAQLLD
jgi:phenylpyruvate tautomerase PptA (4-oxalocrotonate tautomerase family)